MERDMSVEAIGSGASQRINRRLAFTRWVRRTHGWFGLWGALLGLMMGTSGVWLNHRATLKLELPAQRTLNGQLALPDARFGTPEAMAIWLANALKVEGPANQMRVERSRPVAWAEKEAEKGSAEKPPMQPERWSFAFGSPSRVVQVEYWRGNASVSVRTVESGFIATLTNLHKGIGMPVPWILLIDTLAGSLIFLSLSGVILWWETNRRRTLGIAIFATAVVTTAGLALWPLS
ncbi:MAG: PepSY-associated TM helix domain-containing protein [Alphaproteobacteria bacterium]|nr:PepSY-associated TM helix domain-containing protein [Alphaproteobacteria bacterium]